MILLMFTENVKENKCPDSQLSKSDAFQITISDSDLDLVRFFLKMSKISRLTKNVNKRALGFKFFKFATHEHILTRAQKYFRPE